MELKSIPSKLSRYSEQYNQAPLPTTLILIAPSENVLSYETGMLCLEIYSFKHEQKTRAI